MVDGELNQRVRRIDRIAAGLDGSRIVVRLGEAWNSDGERDEVRRNPKGAVHCKVSDVKSGAGFRGPARAISRTVWLLS
jgi:hypothetical protein